MGSSGLDLHHRTLETSNWVTFVLCKLSFHARRDKMRAYLEAGKLYSLDVTILKCPEVRKGHGVSA